MNTCRTWGPENLQCDLDCNHQQTGWHSATRRGVFYEWKLNSLGQFIEFLCDNESAELTSR
jgi:hypothetical protein